MSIFDDLADAFGRRLGIAGLAPGRGGCVDLAIEKVGRLQLEADGDWLLATLARPKPPHAAGAARALLKIAHWRENHPWPIHPGMRGEDWLTLTARLPLAEADVPALERAVGTLSGLLDSVEAAG